MQRVFPLTLQLLFASGRERSRPYSTGLAQNICCSHSLPTSTLNVKLCTLSNNTMVHVLK